MAKRLLHLVRHGHYNVQMHDKGKLTPTGQNQAQAVADAFRERNIQVMHHSPIYRAIETAEIIQQAIPHVEMRANDDLRECIPSVPDRLSDLFAEFYPDVTPDSLQQCTSRLDNLYNTLFVPSEGDEDLQELVVCHGNVIRYLVSQIVGANSDAWVNMIIHHCGITRVLVDTDGFVCLVSHNDIGHLSDALRTEN